MINIELRIDHLRIAITVPLPSTVPTQARSQLGAKDPSAQPERWLPRTSATSLCVHESSVLSRLRKRLAEKFEQPVDHRFFSDRYLPGETPNEALLRMFKRLQWSVSLTDEQTIESLARYK
jgi:hypothetical protein